MYYLTENIYYVMMDQIAGYEEIHKVISIIYGDNVKSMGRCDKELLKL